MLGSNYKDIDQLRAENEKLRSDIKYLRDLPLVGFDQLIALNNKLAKEKLEARNEQLCKDIDQLRAENEIVRALLVAQGHEIVRLRTALKAEKKYWEEH